MRGVVDDQVQGRVGELLGHDLSEPHRIVLRDAAAEPYLRPPRIAGERVGYIEVDAGQIDPDVAPKFGLRQCPEGGTAALPDTKLDDGPHGASGRL